MTNVEEEGRRGEPAPRLGGAGETAMRRVQRIAERAARSRLSVLILGETGVGKDVLARAIHASSPRASAPFLPINCAALPPTLVDSELFGHEKGAFTGAISARPGLLEGANGGTVFLDELGEIPPSTQAKLLRVLEDRVVMPIGRGRPRSIDVRFIAATNCDVERAIQEGAFRDDLFFRLGAVVLRVPPLRERLDEIPTLAALALREAADELGGCSARGITPEAIAVLQRQRWPGNIRELKNVIRRACLMADGTTLKAGDLQAAFDVERGEAPIPVETAQDSERERIRAALSSCAGNQTKAANVLGMARRTLITRLERYNLPRPQKGTALLSA